MSRRPGKSSRFFQLHQVHRKEAGKKEEKAEIEQSGEGNACSGGTISFYDRLHATIGGLTILVVTLNSQLASATQLAKSNICAWRYNAIKQHEYHVARTHSSGAHSNLFYVTG